jgi:hypothetical protein
MVLETPCPWRKCFASLALQKTRDVASGKSRLQSPWSCRRRVHASYDLLGSISEGSRFLAVHVRSLANGRDEHCGREVHELHAGGGRGRHSTRMSCLRSPSPYTCTASDVSPSSCYNGVRKVGR